MKGIRQMDKIGVKKTAEILGVSKRTVYRKLKSGDISGEKIKTKYGQKWVIDKEDLQEKAKLINESVEVKEVNKAISKEELFKAMQQVAAGSNEKDIQELKQEVEKLNYKFDKVLTALQELYILQLENKKD